MFTQNTIMCILYSVLAMIIVSLDKTYNITYNLFGKLTGSTSQIDFGTGMNLHNKGFFLHILVFALLMVIPKLVSKGGVDM